MEGLDQHTTLMEFLVVEVLVVVYHIEIAIPLLLAMFFIFFLDMVELVLMYNRMQMVVLEDGLEFLLFHLLGLLVN